MYTSNDVCGRPKACSVSGCKDVTSRRHRFPKRYRDVFKAWVTTVKPKNYKVLSTEEIYSRYVVCENHFAPEDLVPGRRGLKVNAIPSLHIPETQVLIDSHGTELGDVQMDMTIETENVAVSAKRIKLSDGASFEDTQATPGSSWQINDEVISSTMLGAPRSKVIGLRKGFRRGKFSLLGLVNVTRSSDLTSKEKILYHTLRKWSIEMAQKQRKIVSYRQRLANAEKLIQTPNFNDLLKNVNSPTFNFIMCQVRNQKVKPRARRYTLDEKVLALSLYKASGKGYRLLSKIFSLPSIKTLNSLLQKIPMKPGINKYIFNSFKHQVEKMKDPKERTCVLIFDEMEVDASVKYCRKSDEFFGFQDDGESKSPLIADHVNVFMVRGVYRQWKQPVVFSFSSGPMKAISLKRMIRNVIEECVSIGLDVVATVCDQGATNQSAINMLLKDVQDIFTRKNEDNPYFGFLVKNKEIIPLYDYPHLFKGIRNNLLNKNLHFVFNGVERVAKWSHIETFYKLDALQPNLRLCNKLTDAHIYPTKIKKMKVKNCTQVFSHTVGSLMMRISQWDKNFNMPPESEDTAQLILFLDSLFDSFNIIRYTKVQAAKPLKCPVTQNSQHQKFWTEAITVVRSMRFFSPKKKSFVANPTIKNLLFTIKGLSILVKKLLNEKKFKFILTGAFNQDPLENFFSFIRSHGIRNINPDPAYFIGSFKSLVANNCMAVHSPGSNCQKDITEGLDNFRLFLTGEIVSDSTVLQENIKHVEIPNDITVRKCKLARCTIMYMSGAVIKMILKSNTIKNCLLCKNNLLRRHQTGLYEDDEIIDVRQYERGTLLRPGDMAHFVIQQSLEYLFFLIPRNCTLSNLSKVLQSILMEKLPFNVLNCPQHTLGEKLCSLLTRCALFWWSKNINKILKGKDTKFYFYFNANKHNKNLIDPIKQEALRKWEKKKQKQYQRHINRANKRHC